MDKTQRLEKIKAEIDDLRDFYSFLDTDTLQKNEGLIIRLATISVLVEEMEYDIFENGMIEMFSQSENAQPYERERPASKIYISLLKQYQSIIKQLNSLKAIPEKIKHENSDLDNLPTFDINYFSSLR